MVWGIFRFFTLQAKVMTQYPRPESLWNFINHILNQLYIPQMRKKNDKTIKETINKLSHRIASIANPPIMGSDMPSSGGSTLVDRPITPLPKIWTFLHKQFPPYSAGWKKTHVISKYIHLLWKSVIWKWRCLRISWILLSLVHVVSSKPPKLQALPMFSQECFCIHARKYLKEFFKEQEMADPEPIK